MSVESARACRRRLVDDPEFMAEVSAAGDAEQRRALVHGAGYELTLEELAEARSPELTDEDSLKVGMADEEMDGNFGGAVRGLTHETE